MDNTLGWGFPHGTSGKEPACHCRRYKNHGSVPELGRSLEDGMTTLSSILTCKIPWTEEPGELQFTGLHRVGHTETT